MATDTFPALLMVKWKYTIVSCLPTKNKERYQEEDSNPART